MEANTLRWKDIEGWGAYSISNHGDIMRKNSSRLRRLTPDKDGYLLVILSQNNIKRTLKVHRLVAQAFIPNPNNLPQVNHKNGIKSDNRVENLEWCTYSENTLHAYATGLEKPRIGFKHTEETKLKISKNRTGIKHTQEWKENMSRIMKGRTFSKETLLKKSLSARKNTFNWKPIMNVHTGKSYPSVTIARTMEGIKEHKIYKAIKNGEYKYL